MSSQNNRVSWLREGMFGILIMALVWYFFIGKESGVTPYDVSALHEKLYQTCVSSNPQHQKYCACKREVMNKLADPSKYAVNDKNHIDWVIGQSTLQCQ